MTNCYWACIMIVPAEVNQECAVPGMCIITLAKNDDVSNGRGKIHYQAGAFYFVTEIMSGIFRIIQIPKVIKKPICAIRNQECGTEQFYKINFSRNGYDLFLNVCGSCQEVKLVVIWEKKAFRPTGKEG